ncbi:hypothetical protein [Streptomyces sp. NPDC046161]|uniref:hypothetical protein n=1 Tax=Streptomyces sp. NPDC046161 TaxID=3155132 RepID=UPI0033DD9B06
MVLRFGVSCPALTCEGDLLPLAERVYRKWVELYGSHPIAVIQLVDGTVSPGFVIKEWTRDDGERTGNDQTPPGMKQIRGEMKPRTPL